MPSKYRVILHRRVQKFLTVIKDPKHKLAILNQLTKLEDYPLSLREMDAEKIKGSEKTFRIRIGKERVIFWVDAAEKSIYVTNVEARKKAYEHMT